MENMKNLDAAEIAAKGNSILVKGSDLFKDLTTDERAEFLAVLLVYRKLLDEKFTDLIKEYEDTIPEVDFDKTFNVGGHKVDFKVKEVISAKAVGLTNEGLKSAYNIADSIISVDTKTIATLKKDKLEEAINAQVPEVLDAMRDGKLSFTKTKTKTSTVK